MSGIDTDRRIVSVEWFEKGETKGKEVGKPWHSAKISKTSAL